MAINISHNIGGATVQGTLPDDVTVDAVNTDGAAGGVTRWTNSNWSQWFGYYVKIPELKQAIDMRATWVLGKGWEADPRTTVILDRMKGWGEDTFNGILKNMIITKRINGDAYAEIIRDKKHLLLNVKPLDPSSITVVVGKNGMLKHYEQSNNNKGFTKFQPNQILHLTNKRVADEIHGRSDIEAVEDIILASNEVFTDIKKLMHRHVKPIMAFKVDTDDQTKIDAFVAKMDAVVNKGENIYIPKGTVEFELVSVPSNATLNPMPWRASLKESFFQAVSIPQILLGNASEFSESSSKVAFVAFSQSVQAEQLEIEEQIKRQLYLEIELTMPVTIQNELLTDQQKDGGMVEPVGMQPSEIAPSPAGVEE